MLNLRERISAFEKLGRFMGQVREKSGDEDLRRINEYFFEGLQQVIREAELYNNWFTPDNVHYAFAQWRDVLTEAKLKEWVEQYPEDHFEQEQPKRFRFLFWGFLRKNVVIT